jgi:hypothetical protein
MTGMAQTYTIEPSTRAAKKWMVTTPTGRTIHFGAAGYEDYTMHGDLMRARDYVRRHAAREDWSDPETAGYWSRWLLWDKPSIRAAVAAIRQRLAPARVVFRPYR